MPTRSDILRQAELLRKIQASFRSPERYRNIHGKVATYELSPEEQTVFNDIIETISDRIDFPPGAQAGEAPTLFI